MLLATPSLCQGRRRLGPEPWRRNFPRSAREMGAGFRWRQDRSSNSCWPIGRATRRPAFCCSARRRRKAFGGSSGTIAQACGSELAPSPSDGQAQKPEPRLRNTHCQGAASNDSAAATAVEQVRKSAQARPERPSIAVQMRIGLGLQRQPPKLRRPTRGSADSTCDRRRECWEGREVPCGGNR